MKHQIRTLFVAIGICGFSAASTIVFADDSFSTTAEQDVQGEARGKPDRELDSMLESVLEEVGFTGKFGLRKTLTERLGRPLNQQRAKLGQMLWFDTAHSLHGDNSCAGCHSPSNGFGDTQPIAIGVHSNMVIGPNRQGPRNQRRSPMVINSVYYPKLMWNSRFFAVSGDPFNNEDGFEFPAPEGIDGFPSEMTAPPGDPRNLSDRGIRHLLQAQAFIPPTETVEVAGFNGICAQEGFESAFCQFDRSAAIVGPELAHGLDLPEPVLDPETGGYFRNDPIRQAMVSSLKSIPDYEKLFKKAFRDDPDPINADNFAKAIAEFEFTLTFANAPLDRFARGQKHAMTLAEKRGALIFFDKGGCVGCHTVAGASNEMFSDFENHVIGVPQLAPTFGRDSNMIYDGPEQNEDFGQEQISGNPEHRYAFRTAPLRNLKVSPAFMHNGAFTDLGDAIRHHLDVYYSGQYYDPVAAGMPDDLHQTGPILPVQLRLSPLLANPVELTPEEEADLIVFVRDALFDDRASPSKLCKLIPKRLPGKRPVQMQFEGCGDSIQAFTSGFGDQSTINSGSLGEEAL